MIWLTILCGREFQRLTTCWEKKCICVFFKWPVPFFETPSPFLGLSHKWKHPNIYPTIWSVWGRSHLITKEYWAKLYILLSIYITCIPSNFVHLLSFSIWIIICLWFLLIPPYTTSQSPWEYLDIVHSSCMDNASIFTFKMSLWTEWLGTPLQSVVKNETYCSVSVWVL